MQAVSDTSGVADAAGNGDATAGAGSTTTATTQDSGDAVVRMLILCFSFAWNRHFCEWKLRMYRWH
jgi:hypothetical protein